MNDALMEWCLERRREGWTLQQLKEELYQASFDVDEVFGDKE